MGQEICRETADVRDTKELWGRCAVSQQAQGEGYQINSPPPKLTVTPWRAELDRDGLVGADEVAAESRSNQRFCSLQMMSVHLEMEGLLNNPGSLMVSSQGYSVVGGGR